MPARHKDIATPKKQVYKFKTRQKVIINYPGECKGIRAKIISRRKKGTRNYYTFCITFPERDNKEYNFRLLEKYILPIDHERN